MNCLLLVSYCCMFDLTSFVHHKGMSAMSSVRSDDRCVESHIFKIQFYINRLSMFHPRSCSLICRERISRCSQDKKVCLTLGLQDLVSIICSWCGPRRSMTFSAHWKDSQMSVKQLGWRQGPQSWLFFKPGSAGMLGSCSRVKDRLFGAASVVIHRLYRTVLVKKKLSHKAKPWMCHSFYVLTPNYGHDFCVVIKMSRS